MSLITGDGGRAARRDAMRHPTIRSQPPTLISSLFNCILPRFTEFRAQRNGSESDNNNNNSNNNNRRERKTCRERRLELKKRIERNHIDQEEEEEDEEEEEEEIESKRNRPHRD